MKERDEPSVSREFKPQEIERRGTGALGIGDQRSGELYVYSGKVILAVNIALVTRRPLLVRGPPGWGKSSLAAAVANQMDWRYREKVISSRTQARDLMSELDLVRRLSDAQNEKGVDPDWRRYIRPGVLWEAFDPVGAQRQRDFFDRRESAPLAAPEPKANRPSVVLLDEMDKADPDVPNNLLVALGSLQFSVDEIGDERGPLTVEARKGAEPLIIVTTNDERDMPRAFLRRCVEIELPALEGPDPDGSQRKELLVRIGTEHLRNVENKKKDTLDRAAIARIADIIIGEARKVPGDDGLIVPSPAEFIDTLRAVHELHGPKANEADIGWIISIAVRKRGVGWTA
jgi:MoxR-like ATPase